MKFRIPLFFAILTLLSGCCNAEAGYFDHFYNSIPSGDDVNSFTQKFLSVTYNLTEITDKWEVTSFAAIAEDIVKVPYKDLPYGKITITKYLYYSNKRGQVFFGYVYWLWTDWVVVESKVDKMAFSFA